MIVEQEFNIHIISNILTGERRHAPFQMQVVYGMVYRGNRFCSDRCRDYYDGGAPGYLQTWRKRDPSELPLEGWRVVTGPPGTVGTNPWQSVIDASERKRGKPQRASVRKQPKLPYCRITVDGHLRWQPSGALRALGFKSVDLGMNGPNAWAKAEKLNHEAAGARKGEAPQKGSQETLILRPLRSELSTSQVSHSPQAVLSRQTSKKCPEYRTWPDRQFRVSGAWAIASDGLQWILQHQVGNDWEGVSFVRSTKGILARCMYEHGVPADVAERLLHGLPVDFAPRSIGKPNRATCYTNIPFNRPVKKAQIVTKEIAATSKAILLLR